MHLWNISRTMLERYIHHFKRFLKSSRLLSWSWICSLTCSLIDLLSIQILLLPGYLLVTKFGVPGSSLPRYLPVFKNNCAFINSFVPILIVSTYHQFSLHSTNCLCTAPVVSTQHQLSLHSTSCLYTAPTVSIQSLHSTIAVVRTQHLCSCPYTQHLCSCPYTTPLQLSLHSTICLYTAPLQLSLHNTIAVVPTQHLCSCPYTAPFVSTCSAITLEEGH